MLKIKKPVVTYKVLDDDSIRLCNILSFDKKRIVCRMRQAVSDDLAIMESWKTAGVSPKEIDEKTLALLIIQWGDRDNLTALEVASLPLESRGVLLDVFRGFCLPSAELVEESDEAQPTQTNIPTPK